jgi:hypothetical protein
MTITTLPMNGQLIFIGKDYLTMSGGFSRTSVSLFNTLPDDVEVRVAPATGVIAGLWPSVTMGELRAWLAEREKAAALGAAAPSVIPGTLRTEGNLEVVPGAENAFKVVEVTEDKVTVAVLSHLDSAHVERAYTEATTPDAPLPSADAAADFDPGF